MRSPCRSSARRRPWCGRRPSWSRRRDDARVRGRRRAGARRRGRCPRPRRRPRPRAGVGPDAAGVRGVEGLETLLAAHSHIASGIDAWITSCARSAVALRPHVHGCARSLPRSAARISSPVYGPSGTLLGKLALRTTIEHGGKPDPGRGKKCVEVRAAPEVRPPEVGSSEAGQRRGPGCSRGPGRARGPAPCWAAAATRPRGSDALEHDQPVLGDQLAQGRAVIQGQLAAAHQVTPAAGRALQLGVECRGARPRRRSRRPRRAGRRPRRRR